MKRLLIILLLLPFIGCGQAVTVDSYATGNRDNQYNSFYGGTNHYVGQTFTCVNAVVLDSCKFYIKKISSPTGNGYARLYAHTGTYGTDGVPTGSPLATSEAFDVSTLTTTFTLRKFTFAGANNIVLNASTYYVIVLCSSTGTNSSNYVQVGADVSSPTHSGNKLVGTGDPPTWTGNSTADIIFYVYGNTNVPSSQKDIFLWTNF